MEYKFIIYDDVEPAFHFIFKLNEISDMNVSCNKLVVVNDGINCIIGNYFYFH
jgi:hypothetical protein